MLKTQDFISNNFHDTQNCEYGRLSAGKSQRFFHTTSIHKEPETEIEQENNRDKFFEI